MGVLEAARVSAGNPGKVPGSVSRRGFLGARPRRYCVSRAGIESISPIQESAERRQI